MVPIKFRGYDTQDGVRDMVTFTLADLLAGTDDYELVDPDSIAQLVGYDKNGAEIYSDDILLDDFGAKVKATIGFNLSYDKLIRPIGEEVGIVEVIDDD